MTDKFKVHRAGKMMDWLENSMTEWAEQLVTEHFGKDIEELTEEEIAEVSDEMSELELYSEVLTWGFRNLIDRYDNREIEE